MFKLFIITISLIVTCSADVSETDNELVEGTLIETNVASYWTPHVRNKIPELECPTGKIGNICADDCKTLLVCTPRTQKPIISNHCADLSTNLPYCIPGESRCTATGDLSNPKCISVSRFVCTDEGYFPDPVDCTKYHLCVDGLEHTYTCPSNYVYDAHKLQCRIKRNIYDCKTINCVENPNKYVPFKGNKAYYAFCDVKSGVAKVVMFRCADLHNYKFNRHTMECEFLCKQEGLYPDDNDCRMYYECYRSGRELIHRVQECPKLYMFDATKHMCVKGTCKVNEIVGPEDGKEIVKVEDTNGANQS